jgi:hypothetical protein
VVYSDDRRISAKTHATGIQHFYFSDYTADYVAGTSFELAGEGGNALAKNETSRVGMKNFLRRRRKRAWGMAPPLLCCALCIPRTPWFYRWL